MSDPNALRTSGTASADREELSDSDLLASCRGTLAAAVSTPWLAMSWYGDTRRWCGRAFASTGTVRSPWMT